MPRQFVPLQPPDTHHLNAAEGWLGLDNVAEAYEELKAISLEARFHPDVLRVRWEAYARNGNWEYAHTIAQGLIAFVPDDPLGWINRSIALHELKRTPEAWNNLLPAALKFPTNWIIALHLARYACQLGRLDEAKNWMKKAVRLDDAGNLMSRALRDPELAPLWPYYDKLATSSKYA
ncbi:MAG: tetratricopeptide repeat protein [Verrucomicrobia subdivision 3 bacterium]|nr:tetratricopeptide repeat protein [Limisphaerales bacterium]